MQIQVYCSKIDQFKNHKNAYHEMRHRHFGSSMNENGRLKIYRACQKIPDWQAIFSLYFEP
jgi:hypothetical protein